MAADRRAGDKGNARHASNPNQQKGQTLETRKAIGKTGMKSVMPVGLLFACLIISSCEPCRHYNRLQVVAYTGPTKAPRASRKPYGTIRPYNTAQDVGRAFEVMGFMSCEASAADEATVLKAMLYRAADMGADGVLLNPAPTSGQNTTENRIDVRFGWAAMIGSGSDRAYRAQAIRFK